MHPPGTLDWEENGCEPSPAMPGTGSSLSGFAFEERAGFPFSDILLILSELRLKGQRRGKGEGEQRGELEPKRHFPAHGSVCAPTDVPKAATHGAGKFMALWGVEMFSHLRSSPSALSLPRAPVPAERSEQPRCARLCSLPSVTGMSPKLSRAAAAGAEPSAGAEPPPGPHCGWVPPCPAPDLFN